MSSESYQKAISIIEQHKPRCFFVGERSEELISKAEDALGFKFTGCYRQFLKKYGAGNFGSQEIFGVIHDDFEHGSVPNAIWYTIQLRDEVNLPCNLLVIYDTGSDEIFCLDFYQMNSRMEPAVVSFVPGVDLDKQTYEKIADDFGDFMLELAENEF